MPLPAPRHPHVRHHPGSSHHEIANEPHWSGHHDHRVGFRNRHGRFPGLTHDGDYENEEDQRFAEEAVRKYQDLWQRVKKGDLINFQDVARGQTVSYHAAS